MRIHDIIGFRSFGHWVIRSAVITEFRETEIVARDLQTRFEWRIPPSDMKQIVILTRLVRAVRAIERCLGRGSG